MVCSTICFSKDSTSESSYSYTYTYVTDEEEITEEAAFPKTASASAFQLKTSKAPSAN